MTQKTDGPVDRILKTLDADQAGKAGGIFKKIASGNVALDQGEEEFILRLVDRLMEENDLAESVTAVARLKARFNPVYLPLIQRLDKSLHKHIFEYAMDKQKDGWTVMVRISSILLLAAHLQMYFLKPQASGRAYEMV